MFQNANFDVQPTQMHQGDTKLHSNPSGRNQVAISIRNASLGWSSEETVLENINLEVTGGSFVALVGKTGSGKSLLLKSAVGEAGHVSGSIELPLDEIAYCSQTPWLENITGQVGSGGVRLSGGQRQRLCTGPYHETTDLNTASETQGLLRRLGTTVLFTTHDSDEVYEITVDRSLAPMSVEKPVNGDAIESRIAQGETTEKDSDEKNTTTSDPATNAIVQRAKDEQDEKDTMVSDSQVYLRYARGMGFKNAGIFLFLVITFAICLKLPAPTSASTLHASLLRTVLLAPSAFISRTDTGSLMNRFNQDLMFVDALLPLDLFNTCAELFTSTFRLILVAIVYKQALAVLHVLFAALYFIQRVYLRSSKQLRLLDLGWKADLRTKFGETASGLSVIRANGWLNPMREKFMEKLDRSQEPIHHEREEQSSVDVPDNWPNPGQITFENVWDTYDDRDGGSDWRLSGVTLIVKPGERVAVCGRTGSGKSTLLLALLGMLHMPVGSVRVDGIDVSALQMTILRRRFKMVSPDSFFEPTSTFRQDLDPSGGNSDVDIEEILKECRVWEVVAASGGLDGKRADTKLSAGEAQLLFIARLLLQNPAEPGGIILLDEATSRRNATVIAVMHRLEAVATYDKFAVLDKGALIDFGDVADFKARCELFK
ncbi:hypothetical protein CcaCcLH18_12210 [Colletotrichum camelliae]|nr:hypothetical protein CcaCcLH18_12210 [Colletotrichum camelliae]